jgi:hypothetical protein
MRFEGAPGSPYEGVATWRAVPNIRHATLCAAFGLDQASTWFDVPEAFRAEGAQRGGHSGAGSRRHVSGFVMSGQRTEPIGKLTIAWDAERFADRDPYDKRDFYDLEHS